MHHNEIQAKENGGLEILNFKKKFLSTRMWVLRVNIADVACI